MEHNAKTLLVESYIFKNGFFRRFLCITLMIETSFDGTSLAKLCYLKMVIKETLAKTSFVETSLK
jgi:hypothetical protein